MSRAKSVEHLRGVIVPGQLTLDGSEVAPAAPRPEHVASGPVVAQASTEGGLTPLHFQCPCGCEQHMLVWADDQAVTVRTDLQ